MQERRKVSLLVGLVAFILVVIRTIIQVPIGIVYELLFRRKDYGTWLWNTAVAQDQLINAINPSLLNKLFKKGLGHLFGNPQETVSGVIGKNKSIENLTEFGKIIDTKLEYFDPGHSIESIDWEENILLGKDLN